VNFWSPIFYSVDAVIQDRGIENMAKLQRVSVQDFGDWLDVDAVMYGRVVHYEAYYLALVAAWQVGIEVRLVSTRDGKTLIKASGSRWPVSLLPAMDPQDIAINAIQNLLQCATSTWPGRKKKRVGRSSSGSLGPTS
jgi:hypothetical protein